MQFIDLKTPYKKIKSNINQAINTVLEHGQYIMGPEVGEFERVLADFTGTKHVIANSSGTDALLMTLMALDIKPGDEIITTPFSFFATAEVIALLQAKPVFVDIEANTYNIDPKLIEKAITAKTKAIIPVSLYGQCPDMDSINEIAAKHNLAVIEDAAQSFGATYKGKQSCNLSTIGCTSFFPSKPLGGYGDSGACFTNDDSLAARLSEIRVHGQSGRYIHPTVGLNARIDTIQAAILLEKMKLYPQEIVLRQQVASRYNNLLSSIVKTPTIGEDNSSVYAQYTIEVDNREAFQQLMNQQNIPTAVHYPIAMHQQAAFKNLGYEKGSFPIAEQAARKVISLPIHPYLSEQEQDKVVGALKKALQKSASEYTQPEEALTV